MEDFDLDSFDDEEDAENDNPYNIEGIDNQSDTTSDEDEDALPFNTEEEITTTTGIDLHQGLGSIMDEDLELDVETEEQDTLANEEVSETLNTEETDTKEIEGPIDDIIEPPISDDISENINETVDTPKQAEVTNQYDGSMEEIKNPDILKEPSLVKNTLQKTKYEERLQLLELLLQHKYEFTDVAQEVVDIHKKLIQ